MYIPWKSADGSKDNPTVSCVEGCPGMTAFKSNMIVGSVNQYVSHRR